tara:strand:- start:793 stop:1104 length:312 start_codon:yes stop_codon:yes gene_type:complete
MSIIGIVLGIVAIGLLIWLKNDQKITNSLHEGDLEAARHAYEALMNDFNNYQVNTDRQISDLKKQIEINNTSINKSLEQIHKGLPGKIRGVIGHIEFSQNNLR